MTRARRVWFAAGVLLCPIIARADEPHGCNKFKWAVVHEQAALNAPQKAQVEQGGVFAFDTAATAHLVPLADAKFDKPPERAPTSPSTYGIVIKMDAPTGAGVFAVSLSGEGWIDVVQDGSFIKPTAFSGVLDCPGIRKSVRFPLEAKPITIQLSGVKTSDLSLIVSRQ